MGNTSELDSNKLIAEFLAANLDRIVEFAGSGVKAARNLTRSKLDGTYRKYLSRLYDRHSRAKSFFIRAEPTPLYDFFVPLDLAMGKRVLSKPGAQEIASAARTAVIMGSGGCGKTMMMRHLLITTLQSQAKTPLFLELRQLNQSQRPLRYTLLETLQVGGLEVDDAYLELALKAGHFCILLDGFDELEHRLRKPLASQIQDLADRYPNNWIIVSSRPDSEIQGWTTFAQLSVCPLGLDSAVELVAKLPFDDPIKARFIDDLRRELFRRHKSFLSNPLLLSIMLLTYSDIAHIPTKLSLFYGQAYDALFHKHDALKGGFQRERRTTLDIQDFARVFSAFCVQSYDRREFAFSRLRALEYLDAARSISQIPFDSSAFLEDALQAACLLVEDGLELTFAHRSFQEYFVARFVSAAPANVKAQLVKRFASSVQRDSVLNLLYEIDPYAVELYYVLPAIDKLKASVGLKRKVGISHYLRFLQTLYISIEFRTEHDSQLGFVIRDVPLLYAVMFALKTYRSGEELSFPTPTAHLERSKQLFLAKVGDQTRLSTKTLTTRSPLTRHLADFAGWPANLQELQRVFDTADDIRKRHEVAQESLERILAGRPGRTAP